MTIGRYALRRATSETCACKFSPIVLSRAHPITTRRSTETKPLLTASTFLPCAVTTSGLPLRQFLFSRAVFSRAIARAKHYSTITASSEALRHSKKSTASYLLRRTHIQASNILIPSNETEVGDKFPRKRREPSFALRAIATLEKDAHGNPRLRLIAPADVGSGDEDRQIDIKSIADSRHKIERFATLSDQSLQIRRKAERAMRRGGDFKRALWEINESTLMQEPRSEWGLLRGSKDAIYKLYHELLHTSNLDIDPEPPVYRFHDAQMSVRGTRQSIDAALEYLHKTNEEDIGTRPLVRAVASHSGKASDTVAYHLLTSNLNKSIEVRDITQPRLANEIPIPSKWTYRTLLEYVKAVTMSRKPASATSGRENRLTAGDLLVDVLLRMPVDRHALSYAAFHTAISYLLEQNLHPLAVQIMARMSSLGFPGNVYTFNLFLYAGVSEQNMGYFTQYQMRMYDEGVRPNAQTWLILLLAADSIRMKQIITRMMLDKGMDPARAYSIENAPSFVPFSLAPFLDSGGSHLDYISALDKLFGPRWFSQATVELFVDTMCIRGDITAAIEVVDLYVGRCGMLTRRGALHRLLLHMADTNRNAALSVWLLVYADKRWLRNVVDHVVLDHIFTVAKKSKKYNLLRVAWRYAAATGELKPSMRAQIVRSLRMSASIPCTDVPYLKQWDASFGAVACHATPEVIRNSGLDAIMERERSTWSRTKPAVYFVDVAVEAYFMDEQWVRDGLWMVAGVEGASTEWKIANAIKIPLVENRPAYRI